MITQEMRDAIDDAVARKWAGLGALYTPGVQVLPGGAKTTTLGLVLTDFADNSYVVRTAAADKCQRTQNDTGNIGNAFTTIAGLSLPMNNGEEYLVEGNIMAQSGAGFASGYQLKLAGIALNYASIHLDGPVSSVGTTFGFFATGGPALAPAQTWGAFDTSGISNLRDTKFSLILGAGATGNLDFQLKSAGVGETHVVKSGSWVRAKRLA